MAIASTSVAIPAGGSSASPIAVTVPLNFVVPAGDYRLVKVSGPTFRYQSGNFPLPLGSSGTILTSSDGITWTLRTSRTSKGLERITYGNGIFLTAGSSGTRFCIGGNF